MPSRWLNQIDFSTGELDPRALARLDIERHPSAVALARNVLLEKTGAAKVRGAWRWVLDVPANVPVQLVGWERGDADYLIALGEDTSLLLLEGGSTLVASLQGTADGYVLSALQKQGTGAVVAQNQTSQHVNTGGTGGHLEAFGLVEPPLPGQVEPGWTASGARMVSVSPKTAVAPIDPFRLDTETFDDVNDQAAEWTVDHQFWSNQNLLVVLLSWEGSDGVDSVTIEPDGIAIELTELVVSQGSERGVAAWGVYDFVPQSGPQVVEAVFAGNTSGSWWLASFVSAAGLPGPGDVAAHSSGGSVATSLLVPNSGFGAGSVGAIDAASDSQSILLFHEDVKPHRLQKTEADGWVFAPYPIEDFPYHRFQAPGVTLDPSGTSGSVTLTTSDAHWRPDHVGSIVRYGSGKGRIEVAGYTSPTEVSGTVLDTLASHAATADWDEVVWSTGRGWPISGAWHQGRLVIGGARDLRDGLWLSKVGEVAADGTGISFDIGSGADDDAIAARIRADDGVNIQYVRSQGPLLILASGTEWIVPQKPVTPTDISLDLQASQGVARLKPADLDGALVYLRSPRGAGGEQPAIHFAWDELSQRYRALDIGVLGQHLIRNPVDIAAARGTRGEANNTLYLANADGTVAVLHLPSLERPGMTLLEGVIQPYSLAVVEGALYAAALYNGAHRIFRLDPDSHLDASAALDNGTDYAAVLGVFPWLADQEVTVKGLTESTGWQVQQATADATGAVTVATAIQRGEVGIAREWRLQRLPLEASPATVGSLKSPVEARLQLQDALGVEVGDPEEGRTLMTLDDGSAPGDVTTDPATLFSGHLREHLGGWSEEAIVEAGGTAPWPARVLSFNVKVEF